MTIRAAKIGRRTSAPDALVGAPADGAGVGLADGGAEGDGDGVALADGTAVGVSVGVGDGALIVNVNTSRLSAPSWAATAVDLIS